MACSKLGIELVQVVSFRKESQIWIFCQYFHLTLPGKQINANSCILPHFVTSAVILYGLVWGSTWPLIIATILHSLLPWSPMLLYKLWSQFCCISYEANAVELGIIQVCHCENSRRAPSLPFAGALGQPFCPDFPCQAVCFCAHFCYVGALIRKRNLSTCCGY